LQEVSVKAPSHLEVLEDAENYVENVADEAKKVALKPALENCPLQATHLKELYTNIMAEEDDSRWNRYVKAARIIGKGGRVEELVKGILDHLQFMAMNFPEVTTPRSKEQLVKAMEDVSKMEASLPDGFEDAPTFAHYISGAQNINTGTGTQNNNNSTGNQNTGPGNQFVGTNHIGTQSIFKESS
jgi:hypothetical protein